MGHGRLRDPDHLGEVAHAQLARLEQRVEQPRPRRVTEQLEHLRQPARFSVVDDPGPDVCHPVRIDEPGGTGIEGDNI